MHNSSESDKTETKTTSEHVKVEGDTVTTSEVEETKTTVTDADGLIASLTAAAPAAKHRITVDIAPATIFRLLFTVAAVWLLMRIFPVLILIVLSLMLVATFNPLVRKWQARLGRSWAIVAVVTALITGFLGTLALLIPSMVSQGAKVVQNAPHYTHQLQNMLAQHKIHVNIQKQVEQFSGKLTEATPELMRLVTGVVGVVAAFVTVGILTIYLLIEGPDVGTAVMRLLPRKERLRARRLAMEIGAQVGGYMRGQIFTSALAGVFSFLTLWIVGVPAALALGALAAIADAIPLIGLLVALVPAALLALTVSPSKAGIVIVAYLVYHQVEDHFIAPKVYGSALGLSLSVIVISLLIGVELMGMLGAVLALPVAAAIPSIIAFIQEWQELHSAPETEPHLP
jgi:predicted PurR-regulated permease PerM